MTEAKILIGIMQNDDRAWRFICRNMKPGFATIIGQAFSFGNLTKEDIEDLFQEFLKLVQFLKRYHWGYLLWRNV